MPLDKMKSDCSLQSRLIASIMLKNILNIKGLIRLLLRVEYMQVHYPSDHSKCKTIKQIYPKINMRKTFKNY